MAELKTYDVTVNGFPTQLRLTPEQAAEIGAPEHVPAKPKRRGGRRTTRKAADVVTDPVKTDDESTDDDGDDDETPDDDESPDDETPKE